MADDEEIVSLDEYRSKNHKTDQVASQMSALSTKDLESRCRSSFYSESEQYDLVAGAELYRRDHKNPFGLVGKAIIAANAGSYSRCMSALDCAEGDCQGNAEVVITRAMLYIDLMGHRDFRREDATAFVRGAKGIHFDNPDIMEAMLKVSIFVLKDPELSMQIYDTLPGTNEDDREFYQAHIGLLIKELEEDAAEKIKAADSAEPAKNTEPTASAHPYLMLVKP